jgi:hypothetical protein
VRIDGSIKTRTDRARIERQSNSATACCRISARSARQYPVGTQHHSARKAKRPPIVVGTPTRLSQKAGRAMLVHSRFLVETKRQIKASRIVGYKITDILDARE